MENTRKITTTAMLVALAAVFSLILYVLPFIQSFMFIAMIPIVIVGIKYDIQTQLLGLLALCLLLMMLDPVFAIMIGVWMGLFGIAQSFAIKKKQPVSALLLWSTLAFVFGFIAILYLTNMMLGIDIMAEMNDVIGDMVAEMKIINQSSPLVPAENMDEFITVLDQMQVYIPLLMPMMLLFYGFISSVLTYVVTKPIFKRLKLDYPTGKFKDFRIDQNRRNNLMIVMLVVTIASLVDRDQMEFYILNFTSVLLFLMQINGFALVWYRTDNHPNKKALRIIAVIAFVLAPAFILFELLMRYGLAMLGFMDMYVNFRERFKSKDNS